MADYSRAIELKPDVTEFFNLRGGVFSDLKNYDAALVDYSKAIALKPG